jgi:hypothetical protein
MSQAINDCSVVGEQLPPLMLRKAAYDSSERSIEMIEAAVEFVDGELLANRMDASAIASPSSRDPKS